MSFSLTGAGVAPVLAAELPPELAPELVVTGELEFESRLACRRDEGVTFAAAFAPVLAAVYVLAALMLAAFVL